MHCDFTKVTKIPTKSDIVVTNVLGPVAGTRLTHQRCQFNIQASSRLHNFVCVWFRVSFYEFPFT